MWDQVGKSLRCWTRWGTKLVSPQGAGRFLAGVAAFKGTERLSVFFYGDSGGPLKELKDYLFCFSLRGLGAFLGKIVGKEVKNASGARCGTKLVSP